jgi:hypothetical protein
MVYQFYANAYKDQIPIGYSGGLPWTGYYICESGTYYPLMGCLYQGNFLDVPQAFYCPSQVDPRWQFATQENVYPPPNPGSTRGRDTRAGRRSSGDRASPMRRCQDVADEEQGDPVGHRGDSSELAGFHECAPSEDQRDVRGSLGAVSG